MLHFCNVACNFSKAACNFSKVSFSKVALNFSKVNFSKLRATFQMLCPTSQRVACNISKGACNFSKVAYNISKIEDVQDLRLHCFRDHHTVAILHRKRECLLLVLLDVSAVDLLWPYFTNIALHFRQDRLSVCGTLQLVSKCGCNWELMVLIVQTVSTSLSPSSPSNDRLGPTHW